METRDSSGVFGQEEMVDPHDPVYPFMVYLLFKCTVQESGYSSIAVCRFLISDLPDQRKIFCVIWFRVVSLPFSLSSCVLV